MALTSAAISFASPTKSSVLATKSVSQFTSTSAPEFPSTWAQTTPSEAIREDFFAAAARPFVRRWSIAASMSPSDAVSAALQSIRPAPVFSRSSLTIPDVICIPLDLPDRSGRSGPGIIPPRRGSAPPAGAFGAMETSSSPSVEMSDTVTSGASASLSMREAFFSA